MITKTFYCFEELLEYLYKHNYHPYAAGIIMDLAFRNYYATGKWYIEVEPIVTMKLKDIKLQICQN